jgi:hypothetical protein
MSLRDDYATLTTTSDFGRDESYDWLRDTACICFNPPEEDGAEEEIVAEAMLAAAEYIEAQPCSCVYSEPGQYIMCLHNRAVPIEQPPPIQTPTVPWDAPDVCARCKALGRYFDVRLSR